MCGIAGIISPDTNNVNLNRLQQMSDAIKHRGPDGEGHWINDDGNVGLGHRRLSIIDLSAAGYQPMHYANRYTITYNGELYNYIELKKQLQLKGFLFSSQTDTEVILAAYAHYGKDCLTHFDGMFAFALWDSHTNTLFCARDRFGEKPFFYALPQQQFIFASEMKALWAIGYPRQTNNGMLLNYLVLGLTNDPLDQADTFFKNIFSLPAGHYLQLTMDSAAAHIFTINIQSYWDLDSEKIISMPTADACAAYYQLLQTSVKRRLRSDVPVGTSLSGGLDSSCIVALINSQANATPNYGQATFSATFPGFKNNESNFIDQVNSAFALKGHHVTPTAANMANNFEKVVWHQEEPFQSASVFAQYKVYELAKQHGVTVLLDGQGADETMGGYHQYYHWYWQELLAAFEWKQLKHEISEARKNGVTDGWNIINFLAAFAPHQAALQLQKRAERKVQQSLNIHPNLLREGKKPQIYKPTVSHLNKILYYNTMQLGLGALLRYADRNAMAHSTEVRLPFLQHNLVSFVFSLPSNYKIRHGFTKWILRDVMKDHLPASIVWRKDKIGFEPPQHQWLQHPDMVDRIHESRKQLVGIGVLTKKVLNIPLQTADAHHANNNDWRYLCAAQCLK